MISLHSLISTGLPLVRSAAPEPTSTSSFSPCLLLYKPVPSEPCLAVPERLPNANGNSGAALPHDLPAVQECEACHGSSEVFHSIVALVAGANVQFLGPHDPCRTSEDSVRVRCEGGWSDTTLHSGAKAMLLVSKDQGSALLVLPADGRLSWKKVRTALPGTKSSGWRLASEEEVSNITGGCVPGSVPPFGSAFQGQKVSTYADVGFKHIDRINFNCGLRTRSIRLATEDFIKIESPNFCELSE